MTNCADIGQHFDTHKINHLFRIPRAKLWIFVFGTSGPDPKKTTLSFKENTFMPKSFYYNRDLRFEGIHETVNPMYNETMET